MAEWIDITLPLQDGMPLYPGTEFECKMARKLSEGDSSNNSHLSMGLHVGTHVDAPLHHFDGGASIDQIPVQKINGKVLLIESPQKRVTENVLRTFPLNGVKKLLIKTPGGLDGSRRSFDVDYGCVTPDGAMFLANLGIELIGIDSLSIEEFQKPGRPAHKALLGAGIVIVEGLMLAHVEAGEYEFVCCPLRLTGSEAAPARAFLIAANTAG